MIDAGGGTNTIQANSNPTSHDTIIADATGAGPLTDAITGPQLADGVVIEGPTALSPNDFTNDVDGLICSPYTCLCSNQPSDTDCAWRLHGQ